MKNHLLIFFVLLLNVIHVFAISDPLYKHHPTVEVPFSTSNLPIVMINLDEKMAEKDEDRRVPATMKIIWDQTGGTNSVTSTENYDYNGRIGIKYRGNSSYGSSDKKPFAVRLEDSNGAKLKASILGMGKDEDWALLAPYNDKSMIRDVLMFDLMRGTLEYVPTGKYCELVLNGVYQGIYIMAARVRQGSNRINIQKPSADTGDGLTGGYHLEIDRSNEPGFWGSVNVRTVQGNTTNQKAYYQYKYPDEADLSEAQKTYIQNLVRSMETDIAGSNYKDPSTGYRKYLDTLSLMDFFIAQELSKNVDAYRLSTPLYKYNDSKDKRFKFSIWDFNITMGNADYLFGWSTEGWTFNQKSDAVPYMFKRVLMDEVFYSNLAKRWKAYRLNRLSDNRIIEKIDSLVNLLQEAQVRNFTAWSRFSTYVWPNYYIATSWNDEIAFLKDWLLKRVKWIDSQWSAQEVNEVANAGFEASVPRWKSGLEVWLSEWEKSNSDVILTTLAFNVHSGNYALAIPNNRQAYQVLTELSPGKYTLRFWAKTQADPGASVYLRYYRAGGSGVIQQKIEGNKQYHLVEIRNIDVSNSIAELGFTTENKTGVVLFCVDDIEFIKQTSELPNIPTRDNTIDRQESITIKVDQQNMRVEISNEMMPSNLRVMVYDITGKVLYSDKMNQSTYVLENIFIPNQVYLIRVGSVVKKVAF